MKRSEHQSPYPEERHVKTLREIQALLAKQYPSDFPEIYREQNINMDRLFVLWHHEFGDRFSRVVHEDIKSNGDENLVTLFERAHTDAERLTVVSELKRRLY